MPKFRLNPDHPPVDLFRPAGDLDSIRVEPDQEIEVPGELVTSRPEAKDDEPEPEPLPDDAYLVVNNGEERAWPHALWELVDPPAAKNKSKPAVQAEPVKED